MPLQMGKHHLGLRALEVGNVSRTLPGSLVPTPPAASGHPDGPPPLLHFGRRGAYTLPTCACWEIWGLFLSHPYLNPCTVLRATSCVLSGEEVALSLLCPRRNYEEAAGFSRWAPCRSNSCSK